MGKSLLSTNGFKKFQDNQITVSHKLCKIKEKMF